MDCRLSATGVDPPDRGFGFARLWRAGIDPPLPGPPLPGSGGLIFVWTFVVFDIVKREKHEICV